MVPAISLWATPRATIDLGSWDPESEGLRSLDGRWDFAWNRLFGPGETPFHGTDTFQMPRTWNGLSREGRVFTGFGYATFAVRVHLPETLQSGRLWMEPASTSYRLWANGALVAENGVPSTDATSTVPYRAIRSPLFSAPEGTLDLVLQVANFDHRVGGMWRPIWIGTDDRIAAKDIIDIGYDILLLGICLAFAAHNLVMYLAGSRASSAPLLLAAFFLAVSIRIPTLGSMLLTRVLPGFPWHAQIFIEYMTGHLIIAFFALTLVVAYPRLVGAWYGRSVLMVMGTYSALLVIGGVTRYSYIVNSFVAATVVILAWPLARLAISRLAGNRDAGKGILAIAVVAGIVVSEWAHYSELILSRDGMPFGFLLGVFSAPPAARTAAQISLNLLTIGIVLLAAGLLLFKMAQGLFTVATREAIGAETPLIESTVDKSAPGESEPVGPTRPIGPTDRPPLSSREEQITRLVADGLSNKEIAAVLKISDATVRTHLYRIFRKMNAGNRTELARLYRGASGESQTVYPSDTGTSA